MSLAHRTYLVFFFYLTLYQSLDSGKFGPPYQGKATATARAALPSPTSERWVFSFRVPVIHRTLTTWTTGSLTCVLDHSYACIIYTRWLGTPTASQHNIFDSETLVFLVLLTGVELGSWNVKSDVLPTEPPRHIVLLRLNCNISVCCRSFFLVLLRLNCTFLLVVCLSSSLFFTELSHYEL